MGVVCHCAHLNVMLYVVCTVMHAQCRIPIHCVSSVMCTYTAIPGTAAATGGYLPIVPAALPIRQIHLSSTTSCALLLPTGAEHAGSLPSASRHTGPNLVLPAADDDVPAFPAAVCPGAVFSDGSARPSVSYEPSRCGGD